MVVVSGPVGWLSVQSAVFSEGVSRARRVE